jgi:hypothetical protein
LVEALARAIRNERLPDAEFDEGRDVHDVATLLHDDLSNLGNDEAASDDLRNLSDQFADQLEEALTQEAPGYVRALPAAIRGLIAEESAADPNNEAAARLVSHRPRFVLFSDDDRQLPADFDMAGGEEPPASLRNLLSTAGLAYEDVQEAALEGNQAELQRLQRVGNQNLAQAFQSWRQAEVTVEVRINGTWIHLLPLDLTTEIFDALDDRSDGLRTFIALLTFLAKGDFATPPVLLIDEAEAHLHYDAQADLVRVFERQEAASAVLYTTHSAGCLPEDFGNGVRVIAPTDDSRSAIGNWFWREGAGLTPMLLAMGASALAFTPARFAVIAEGPSDAILLASMMREARGLGLTVPLGFQVAPGVAIVVPHDVEQLEVEAGRVVYLVDSDEGGRSHAMKLIAAGVAENRIRWLGGRSAAEL